MTKEILLLNEIDIGETFDTCYKQCISIDLYFLGSRINRGGKNVLLWRRFGIHFFRSWLSILPLAQHLVIFPECFLELQCIKRGPSNTSPIFAISTQY